MWERLSSLLAGFEPPPLHVVLRVGWASMTLLALSSFIVPYVDRLADHGKLLPAGPSEGGSSSTSSRRGKDKPKPSSSVVGHVLEAFLHRCTVPKRWFWHFYAFSALWTALLLWSLHTNHLPTALRPIPFPGTQQQSPALPALVGLALLEAQALRRLWESLCLFQYGDARMHLAGYLVGFAHYGMAALSLVADPACWRDGDSKELESEVTAGLIVGALLFVAASIEQYRCHAALAALRKPSSPTTATTTTTSSSSSSSSSADSSRRRSGRLLAQAARATPPTPRTHAPPRGHWGFGLVACPHYACEALLYLALALLFVQAPGGAKGLTGNGTAALLALWVVANLGVTAEKTRRWYRQRFPKDFPPSRAAMIPGVW